MKRLNNYEPPFLSILHHNQKVLTIHFNVGIITIAKNYSLLECVKLFWDSIRVSERTTDINIADKTKTFVRLNFITGEHTYSSSYEPDTKSQFFWECVMVNRPECVKKLLEVETPEQAYERAMKIL